MKYYDEGLKICFRLFSKKDSPQKNKLNIKELEKNYQSTVNEQFQIENNFKNLVFKGWLNCI